MKECTSKPHIALRNLFLHNLKYILLIAVPCIALILVFFERQTGGNPKSGNPTAGKNGRTGHLAV